MASRQNRRAKGETPMKCRTDKSMYAPNETVWLHVDDLPAQAMWLRLVLLHLEKTVLTEEIAAYLASLDGRRSFGLGPGGTLACVR